MIVFTCFLLLCVATFLLVAYTFISGTLASSMDEISCEFQALSSNDCNYQGFLCPCIFILKEFEGACNP